MIDEGFAFDLIRYGTVKADTEIDAWGAWYRIQVFEWDGKKYYTVRRNGEFVECKEV